MSAYPVRRVAAMHDLSCFGRGSLTTILPVLSVLGVQVLPLPTTLLSTHTGGFEGFTFTDLTPELYKIADHWEKLGIRPDAIYTGFLSGAAQCDFIEDFITRFGGADVLTLIDPVMGDDGELYSQSTEALVDRMRELCRRADIIVPNLTEACLLCDVPYPDTAAMSPTALAACISALLDRLTALLPDPKSPATGRTVCGGNTRRDDLYIAPTVLLGVKPDAPVMQEEIFGPILPILTYRNLDEAIQRIRQRPRPLALYLFTRDKAVEKKVLGSVSFGGGCVNDTVLHLATCHMPFGGVGESGMGGYHGLWSFRTFSHEKSILKRWAKPDIALRYAPFRGKMGKLKKLI